MKELVNDDKFKEIVKASNTVTEVLKKCGYAQRSGGAFQFVRNRIDKLGLDISHFRQPPTPRCNKKVHYSDRLVNDQSKAHRVASDVLRRSFLEFCDDAGKEYKCELCDIEDEWMGKPLKLHLDHKDGDYRNNEPANLRWLCPNCHGQQETTTNKKCSYKRSLQPNTKTSICERCNGVKSAKADRFCSDCWRVISKQKEAESWPSIEDMKKMIWEKPMVKIAKELGKSDVAVRKFCERNQIDRPPRGYWN